MYWLHSLKHLPQQLVTGYRVYRLVLATQPCTLALTTGYREYRPVLATQPCTLALTTGYRVYWLVLATQPCTLALITGYRVYRPVPATQSCTLASALVTECTGRYRLYSLVHLSNWLHMASTYRLQVYRQGTAYTVLTVQCFTQPVT